MEVTCETVRTDGGISTANTAVAIEPFDAVPTLNPDPNLDSLDIPRLSCFCSTLKTMVAHSCKIYVKRCPYVNTATPLNAFFRTWLPYNRPSLFPFDFNRTSSYVSCIHRFLMMLSAFKLLSLLNPKDCCMSYHLYIIYFIIWYNIVLHVYKYNVCLLHCMYVLSVLMLLLMISSRLMYHDRIAFCECAPICILLPIICVIWIVHEYSQLHGVEHQWNHARVMMWVWPWTIIIIITWIIICNPQQIIVQWLFNCYAIVSAWIELYKDCIRIN